MRHILKHRSMEPPLYVGGDSVVGEIDLARQFPTFLDAERARLAELGAFAPLYQAEPTVTPSKGIRKTVSWKKAAHDALEKLEDAEVACTMWQGNYDRACNAAATSAKLASDWQAKYQQAHRVAVVLAIVAAVLAVLVVAR